MNRQIEEVLSVGKKDWPAMRGVLSRIDLGEPSRSSSAGANTHERR